MPKDGTVLKDEQSRMVFNQESYCELIKHLLKNYVGISYAEASALVEQSHLAEPVATYMEAALLNHELWRNGKDALVHIFALMPFYPS